MYYYGNQSAHFCQRCSMQNMLSNIVHHCFGTFIFVCSVIACVTFVIVVKSYNCCHVVLSHFALPGGLEI